MKSNKDLWEGAEEIYSELLAIEVFKGSKKFRLEPISSCVISIYGLSDGSLLLYCDREIIFKKNKKLSGYVHLIEAQKGMSSLWPSELFCHQFKSKSKPKLVHISNNVIRIMSSNGKKLWKPFDYSREDVNAEPEYYKE